MGSSNHWLPGDPQHRSLLNDLLQPSNLQGELKEAQATSATITAARDTLAEEAAGLRGQLTAAQAAMQSAQVRLRPVVLVAARHDSRQAKEQGSTGRLRQPAWHDCPCSGTLQATCSTTEAARDAAAGDAARLRGELAAMTSARDSVVSVRKGTKGMW